MPGPDHFCIVPCKRCQVTVVAIDPDQALTGRFHEGESETGTRDRSGNCFSDILNGLDEMGLPENDVHILWFMDFDNLELNTTSHTHHTGEMGQSDNKWVFIIDLVSHRFLPEHVKIQLKTHSFQKGNIMEKDNLRRIVLLGIICLFFMVVPVYAVKTAEQSLGGSITRGSRFTVTITGIPNSSYYIWLPHTSSMTGEPHDQPPFIADSQYNVMEDPPDGPYTIGSYQYNNGGGMTIRDDIAQSTPEMPNTQYYALVTTDSRGLATVEFRTSFYTGLRSYSVKVENPRSIDSDTLLVELQVYRRTAPVSIEAETIPGPVITASTTPVITPALPPSAAPSVTTTVATPVPTTMPASATTTRRAPVEHFLPVLAAGAAAVLAIRKG